MNTSANPSQVTWGRAAPTIPVGDVDLALSFYRDLLGLAVAFTNGTPVGFLILKRDAAEVHLSLVPGHRGGSTNVAHLMVSDATALHDHLAGHGVRIIKGLRDADYGLRGFVAADPFGNRLDIGQSLPRS